jgi:hypothetical protein
MAMLKSTRSRTALPAAHRLANIAAHAVRDDLVLTAANAVLEHLSPATTDAVLGIHTRLHDPTARGPAGDADAALAVETSAASAALGATGLLNRAAGAVDARLVGCVTAHITAAGLLAGQRAAATRVLQTGLAVVTAESAAGRTQDGAARAAVPAPVDRVVVVTLRAAEAGPALEGQEQAGAHCHAPGVLCRELIDRPVDAREAVEVRPRARPVAWVLIVVEAAGD